MFQTDVIHGDRRANRRYHFELESRFSYEDAGIQRLGAGFTEDLSRGGIRFQTDNPPPDGAEIELRIAWPFLLQDVCPLELLVWGRIIRTDAAGTVLRMTSYEFRTCGERSFVQAGGRAVICSMIG
jgi:hypothetical protein